MKQLVAMVGVLAVLSCSGTRAQQADGNAVAARVGDRTITVKEIEDKWAAEAPVERAEAIQKVYDGRREALDQIVADMLVAEAAKAKNMSADAYVDAEVEKRLKKVTDADVVSFYQANQSQMQGRSLEQMTPAITRFLNDQAEQVAKQALVAELRKAGPPVKVMLDPPRASITVDATDRAVGRANAPVTIVEYSDFQCPYCLRAAPTLKQIRAAYGDKVRFVWKDFPLTQIHPQAFTAAEAGRCAAEQGKFWEYHDKLFGNQEALQPDSLKGYAKELGLNTSAFDTCLDSSKYAEQVRDSIAAGARLGVNSTPTTYINGRPLAGAQPYENFAAIIDEELAR